MSGRTQNGKRYGAVKSLLVRALNRGYQPRRVEIWAREKDAITLRAIAKARGVSIVEALSQILAATSLAPKAVGVTSQTETRYSRFLQAKIAEETSAATVLTKIKNDEYREEIEILFL